MLSPILTACPICQNHGGLILLAESGSREKRVSCLIFFIGDHAMPFIYAPLSALVRRIWMPLKTQNYPVSGMLGTGAIIGLTRSRKDLLLENAFLRQQLLILARQNPRPKITVYDRLKLLILAHVT